MAFDWTGFLVKLATLAPTIVAGTVALKNEADTATKTQLAQDSLNLATGVSQALLSDDPLEKALATLASSITGAVINSTSQAHAASGKPAL